MTRAKRSAQIKAHVPPEVRQQLELFAAEEGPVVTLSDYLFKVVREHIQEREFKRAYQAQGNHMGVRRVSNS